MYFKISFSADLQLFDRSDEYCAGLHKRVAVPDGSWLGEQAALRLLLGSGHRDRVGVGNGEGCRGHGGIPTRLFLGHIHRTAGSLGPKVQRTKLNIEPGHVGRARHLHRR